MHRGSLMFGFAIVATALLGTVSSSAAKPCMVENVRTAQTYGTLQEAVTAATAGDTLKVAGTCDGDTTIEKSLTITGQGKATLNGDNNAMSPGSVVTIEPSITVAITGLIITGGYAEGGGGIAASAEYGEHSSEVWPITLTDLTVAGNTARNGGGIACEGCTMTITNVTVTGNTASFGGGIHYLGGPRLSSLTLNSSTVTRNTAESGGGIHNAPEGLLTLNNSTVARNVASRNGGGISQELAGLVLNNSTVTRNTAAGSGGGIFNEEGNLWITNSAVSHNRTSGSGGGVYATADEASDMSLIMSGSSSVSRNSAAGNGGGVDNNKGVMVMGGSSSVIKNKTSSEGGGIYNDESGGATISYGVGWSGAVSGNKPDDIFNF